MKCIKLSKYSPINCLIRNAVPKITRAANATARSAIYFVLNVSVYFPEKTRMTPDCFEYIQQYPM